MTALTPLIEADFESGPYRLQPYQRVHKRDPELTSPFGDNNHPLPPFVPSEERTVKGVGQ